MSVVEIDLISVSGIELDVISVSGSELTWFLCGGRKYLVLVFASKLTWFLCRGIGIDFMLRVGIELT